MSTEENVQTVKDFFAAIDRGDREGLLALVAEGSRLSESAPATAYCVRWRSVVSRTLQRDEHHRVCEVGKGASLPAELPHKPVRHICVVPPVEQRSSRSECIRKSLTLEGILVEA